MIKRACFVLLSGCLLATVCQAAAGLRSEIRNAPPEKQLAFLSNPNADWYHLNPLTVARFRSLLSQLSREYAATPEQLANWTVKTQGVAREYGLGDSLLSIMESLNRIAAGFGPSFEATYPNMAVAYIMLRNRGFSPRGAVEGIRGVYEAGIKSKGRPH